MKISLLFLMVICSMIACEPKKPLNEFQRSYIDTSIIEIKKGDTIITFDSLGNIDDTIIFN